MQLKCPSSHRVSFKKKSPKTKTYSSSLFATTVHTSTSRRTTVFTVHMLDFRFRWTRDFCLNVEFTHFLIFFEEKKKFSSSIDSRGVRRLIAMLTYFTLPSAIGTSTDDLKMMFTSPKSFNSLPIYDLNRVCDETD